LDPVWLRNTATTTIRSKEFYFLDNYPCFFFLTETWQFNYLLKVLNYTDVSKTNCIHAALV